MSKKKKVYADPMAEEANEVKEEETLDDFDEEKKEGIMKKSVGFFKKHGKTILVGAGALAAGLILGGRRRTKDQNDESEYDEDEYYEDDSDFEDEVNPVTEDSAD